MEDLFDLICKQVSQPLGRRKVLSLVYRATGAALLARMGLRPAYAQSLANGSSCTTSTQCMSGVCDPADMRCGYANGDGPCINGAVCRSGSCSVNLKCQPAGGCNVDADCAGNTWCNEAAHTCTPRLANNTSMPSDPAHTNPILNGTCTTAAGQLVCASGVCDTNDNRCGFANGDGPCISGTVCRSGVCGTGGTCVPAVGGCNVAA